MKNPLPALLLFSLIVPEKYYYPIKGETEKARRDLVWVASRDFNEFEDLYPWRVYFQEDARRLPGESE